MNLLVVVSAFTLTVFALFPALWVQPIQTLENIFSEGFRVGVKNGHGQIILDEYTTNAGFNYYAMITFMKVSLFTLIGVAFAIVGWSKHKKLSLTVVSYLGLFATLYFISMSIPSKKIDRYMLPIYPFLSLLSVYGYSLIKNKIIILVLFVGFIISPLLSFFPYYFTYTSPLYGSIQNANYFVAQKTFGVGMYDLKKLILNRYGDKVRMGFIDTKPMKAIYANSKVFDIRVYGPGSYDIVVLGINENFSGEIADAKSVLWKKDASMYINGLEFWKVYVKED